MNYDEHNELTLRDKLQSQWDADQVAILSQGIVPPWWDEGGELSQDHARSLTVIADQCGVKWNDRNPRLCKPTIHAFGMHKQGNTAAIIRDLMGEGLVCAKDDNVLLTQKGQWVLDIHEEQTGFEYEPSEYVEAVDYEMEGTLFG